MSAANQKIFGSISGLECSPFFGVNMFNLITKELLAKLWSLSKSHMMGKTKKWQNQRIYFTLSDDEKLLIERVIEKKLPEVVIVNAIFTGIFMKNPGSSWDKRRFYNVLLRDILYQWVENGKLETYMFSSWRKTNKRRMLSWDFLAICGNMLKLKKMKTGVELVNQAGFKLEFPGQKELQQSTPL